MTMPAGNEEPGTGTETDQPSGGWAGWESGGEEEEARPSSAPGLGEPTDAKESMEWDESWPAWKKARFMWSGEGRPPARYAQLPSPLHTRQAQPFSTTVC